MRSGPGPFRGNRGTLDLGREGLPERMTVEWRTEGREGVNQTKRGWKSVLCGGNSLATQLYGQGCKASTSYREEGSMSKYKIRGTYVVTEMAWK